MTDSVFRQGAESYPTRFIVGFQDRLSSMHVVGDDETHAQTCTSLLIKLMQIIYLVSLLTFATAGPRLTHCFHFFSWLL